MISLAAQLRQNFGLMNTIMNAQLQPGVRVQQRVEVAEARQNQMMAFLSKALQNPGMLQQLVSSRQSIGRLENGNSSGRTRAPLVPLSWLAPGWCTTQVRTVNTELVAVVGGSLQQLLLPYV